MPEATCNLTTAQVCSMNDTIYRITLYNKAIYRYISYTTYRVVGCTLTPLKVGLVSLNEGLDTLFNVLALHNRLQIRQTLSYGRLLTLANRQSCRFECP